MARRKAPQNETSREKKSRQIKESIANIASRSDKVAWNRKMDNMVKIMAKLRPIEQQIIELQNKKIPIFDEVQALREEMVSECIHPYDKLVIKDGYVECKFCDRKITVVDPE